MGDRTNCILTIGGVLHAKDIPDLAQVLDVNDANWTSLLNDDFDAKPSQHQKSSLADEIAAGISTFEFEEMNYASMPDDLTQILKQLKLSFRWSNEAGGGYGPAKLFYDARNGEQVEYSTVNEDIALTVDDLDKPELVDMARRWHHFDREIALLVVKSNHEMIAVMANDHAMQDYALLHADQVA